MTLRFSCCCFIQELITHLGTHCLESFPFVVEMWRLAREVVAVLEYDGVLKFKCVIYYNSSSWSPKKLDPEPIERVYEPPHCLATLSSYQSMTSKAMLAFAVRELEPNGSQSFYSHPLKLTVPELLRARTILPPEGRLVPLPA